LPSDVTLGLDHWPVHVAAGLLVPTAALLAAFTGRLRILAAIAAALTAITIGVAMASSQSFDVATESAHWSVLAVLWGSALLLAVIWAMGRKIRRRDDAEPSVEAVEG
jgi:drug/metabolite transporter (DMT)-like permease